MTAPAGIAAGGPTSILSGAAHEHSTLHSCRCRRNGLGPARAIRRVGAAAAATSIELRTVAPAAVSNERRGKRPLANLAAAGLCRTAPTICRASCRRHLLAMTAEEHAQSSHRVPRTREPPTTALSSLRLHSELDFAGRSEASAHLAAPTIFHEPWWLDLTTRGRFGVAQVHHGGRVIGSLPYFPSQQRGFRVSVMPPLTHLLGPAIYEGKGSSNTRWLRRLDIVRELIGRIPTFDLFSQICHPGITDVLGFQGCGFDGSVQFSAEVPAAEESVLWRGMRDKTRNVVRRAQERWRLQLIGDPHEFVHFYRRNLETCGERSYFDLGLIPGLFEACQARDRVKLLAVGDGDKKLVAAAFYVWDHRRLWYLLSSRNPAAADNGAVSWLIWEGVREAARRGLVFDFDGIFSMGSARFFSGFGARVQPRYVIRRQSPTFNVFTSLTMWLRGRSSRNQFTGD